MTQGYSTQVSLCCMFIQQSDTTMVGRKNTRPQFILSIPPTPFNKSSKTYAKGSHSYAHPHSVQHFWTRDGGLVRKNNGHQTLAYLLHIMTALWKQCFNTWSLHWCHSMKS